MAVRAWLETVIPPVFGKEMESSERPISQTWVSAIFVRYEISNLWLVFRSQPIKDKHIPLSLDACLRVAASAKAGERVGVRVNKI
jgi:hypothetical protein